MIFGGVRPSKTLPPPMPSKPKVYCCDCKHNGMQEMWTRSIDCKIPIIVSDWYSPTNRDTILMSIKNECNDCPDFELIEEK